jgi:hypothetical protein
VLLPPSGHMRIGSGAEPQDRRRDGRAFH